jgi:cell division protein FtsQ
MLAGSPAVFMARKSSSSIFDDELEGAASESARRSKVADRSPLDARVLDLDDEAESPFLRGQKRVPVRRSALPMPRHAAGWLKITFFVLLVGGGIALVGGVLYRYASQSWRFQLESSENIAVSATNNVSRSQVLEVFASDLDRNVFFVPLEQRQWQLEQIPWVQTASVMRLLPNRLKVVVTERTPVAFVQMNSQIQLIDNSGVVLGLPSKQAPKYSFPVIVGMSESEPLSTRAARMKTYARFIKELDSDGAHYSADISDVDLSDPDDVKATVTDPQGAVLVHLGSSKFLERFKLYVAHVKEWRAQFQKLESVDLRFDHQVIVNRDSALVRADAGKPADTAAAVDTSVAPVATARKQHTTAAARHKKHK